MTELYNGDESFAAVTDREHEDNRDEDGGDEDVPLMSLGGTYKGAFPPDCDVDAKVKN